MRGPILIAALLASTLAACGSGSDNKSKLPGEPQQVSVEGGQAAQAASPGTRAKGSSSEKSANKPSATPVVVHASYVRPTVHLKTKSGKDPAVVLLPDTGDSANAAAEARKLADLGIGAFVVVGPSSLPSTTTAFNQAVATALAAVKTLTKRTDVDPHAIGFIGEGVGAHVGAVAIGRDPRAVAAVVLADIGGTVVPSPQFAPERWLQRANGTQMLFQRDTAKRAMTPAEITRLMNAAPYGTVMQQYKDLGATAQKARDTWIKQKLLAAGV